MSPSPALEGMRVSRSRLSEQVADQIKEMIVSQQLKPGDRLPSEREIAQSLGISRSIVRETIKLLEQQGLVSVQVGRGTFILQVQPANIAEAMSIMLRQNLGDHGFDQIYEIRQMIEIDVARLAALRATEDDLARLEAQLQMMVDHKSDIEKFSQADTDYHIVLAQATHNPLFLTLLMPITHLLRQIQRRASHSGGIDDAISYHAAIIEAVRARDPQRSMELMRAHLISVLQWLEVADEYKPNSAAHHPE